MFRKKITVAVVIFAILILPTTNAISFYGDSNKGRKIMEKVKDKKSAETSISSSVMTIKKKPDGDDGWKDVKTRKFKLYMWDKSDEETRAYADITSPIFTKLLSISYADSEDVHWVKGQNKKVVKITGSKKGNTFINSHLTYEDMSELDIDDYTYKFLGVVELTYRNYPDDDDTTVTCYKVQAKPKSSVKSSYSKKMIYVRKSDYCMIGADFYKNGNSPFKKMRRSRISKKDGILTSKYNVIYMADNSGMTIVHLKKIEYDVDIDKDRFTKRYLEKDE